MSRLLVFGVFLTFTLISMSSSSVVDDQGLVVTTSLGSYRGFVRKSVTNKLVKVFYGIPFAEPPIGSKRYKPPLPVKPHNSTLDCREQAPACLQKILPFLKFHPTLSYYFGLGAKTPSEDCLYLNVFIPKNGDSNLPVMVWLYGGGFMMGTANSLVYDGSTIASDENVIVVTLNYRVGSFGFLYLGMDEAPGNMGLMDQVMAMQWVRDHIGSFGGDPKRVTLFGESAGAMSISHHLMLESSRPLFKRAIMQSGVPHMADAVDTRKLQLEAAAILADNIGCPFKEGNLKATLNCLLSKDSWNLQENEPVHGHFYILYFKPVVDGKYIKEHPELTIRKGLDVTGKDLIIGHNQDEVSFFLTYMDPIMFGFTDRVKVDKQDISDFIRDLYSLNNATVIPDVAINLYADINEQDVYKRYLKLVKRAGTDAAFFCPSLQFEDALLNASNKVYKYRFKYRNPHIGLPKWMGVFHGAEVGSVFGEPLDPDKTFDPAATLLSRRMIRYWTNFARTGDPNVSPEDAPALGNEELPFWQPLHNQEGNYLSLDVGSLRNGFFKGRYCRFWNDILPEIYRSEGQKPIPGKPMLLSLDHNRFYA